MRHDNVVPFDPARRGGLARRGAPDKNGKIAGEDVALQCTSCASTLRLPTSWLEGLDAVLCDRCETEITVARTGSESAPVGRTG